eukprot:6187790-Pleurochrysis_carterae.AAC.1
MAQMTKHDQTYFLAVLDTTPIAVGICPDELRRTLSTVQGDFQHDQTREPWSANVSFWGAYNSKR